MVPYLAYLAALAICGLCYWLLKRERTAYLRDHSAGANPGRRA